MQWQQWLGGLFAGGVAEAEAEGEVANKRQHATAAAAEPTALLAPAAGPPALVCTEAFGHAVAELPLTDRTLPILSDTLMLGRKHQRGFFEKLLGSAEGKRFLTCVSRSHLQVAAGPLPGSLQVTNASINPVIVAGLRVDQGCCGLAKTGDFVEFIAAGGPPDEAEARAAAAPELGGGEPAVVYLRFRLEQVRPQSVVAPSPGSSLGAGCCKRPEDDAPGATGHFWLMLSGTAVQQGFAANRRRVECGVDGIIVGRAHQTAIHADALTPEVVQYISREHFRIERSPETGEWRLCAMTANPIWHVRAGERSEMMKDTAPKTLACGDSVLLFTGAADKTPDGPGNRGSLRWIFRVADEQTGGVSVFPSAAGA